MLSLVKSKTLDYYSSRLKLNIVSYVEIFKTTLVPIKIVEVISLASLGRIVEKCSVNASGMSDGVGNGSVLLQTRCFTR